MSSISLKKYTTLQSKTNIIPRTPSTSRTPSAYRTPSTSRTSTPSRTPSTSTTSSASNSPIIAPRFHSGSKKDNYESLFSSNSNSPIIAPKFHSGSKKGAFESLCSKRGDDIENAVKRKLFAQNENIEHIFSRNEKSLLNNRSSILQTISPDHSLAHSPHGFSPDKIKANAYPSSLLGNLGDEMRAKVKRLSSPQKENADPNLNLAARKEARKIINLKKNININSTSTSPVKTKTPSRHKINYKIIDYQNRNFTEHATAIIARRLQKLALLKNVTTEKIFDLEQLSEGSIIKKDDQILPNLYRKNTRYIIITNGNEHGKDDICKKIIKTIHDLKDAIFILVTADEERKKIFEEQFKTLRPDNNNHPTLFALVKGKPFNISSLKL